jgi:hypothetical protein
VIEQMEKLLMKMYGAAVDRTTLLQGSAYRSALKLNASLRAQLVSIHEAAMAGGAKRSGVELFLEAQRLVRASGSRRPLSGGEKDGDEKELARLVARSRKLKAELDAKTAKVRRKQTSCCCYCWCCCCCYC